MEDCTHAGDGTIIRTETPRRGVFKSLKNALYDSKTDGSGALGNIVVLAVVVPLDYYTVICIAPGETLTTSNGHNSVVSNLLTGRTSEINALHVPEMQGPMRDIPPEDAVSYDKGVRGSFLPNDNHRYQPCFLAPAKGKKKFTGVEAGGNKAIAKNRYVVEISYTRVKDWRILAGFVDREDFHLMNSAWLWSLGFGNLVLGMLRPPPGVPSGVPSIHHYVEWLSKQ